jgi:HSP20 family protein
MTKTTIAPEKTLTPVQRSSRLVRTLGSELDQLFNDFGLRSRFPFAWFDEEPSARMWAPAVECQKKGSDFFVRAELPGLTKENVIVNVTDEAIILEGERKKEETKEEEGYYRSERSYGQFRRVIGLPDGADPKSAVATFKDGVLEIAVHLNPEMTPEMRRLDIG